MAWVSSTDQDEPKRKREDYDTGTFRGHNRKRSNLGLIPESMAAGHATTTPPPPPPPQHYQQLPSPSSQIQSFSANTLNYLSQQSAIRLALVPGDNDTFADIVSLFKDYEGVIDRQESLAANLGAKLTGPLFLRRIEKFFEGPIKTNPPPPPDAGGIGPISWLDIVAFAKSNPRDFILTTLQNGSRCCQFTCKDVLVEISEDDWRLISSGAFDRFSLEHPFEEDEIAELATLDILQQRLSVLSGRADEVAARARSLHRNLDHRRSELGRRRSSGDSQTSRLPPVGGAMASTMQRPHPGNPNYDLHADLLQQFTTNTALLNQSRSTSGAGISVGGGTVVPASPASHAHQLSGSSRSMGASEGIVATTAAALEAHQQRGEFHRSLITQRIDRLAKGDTIVPACDRCRRLRLSCVKHLTACQGCTKKHAKCSWKTVTEEELSSLRQEMGILPEREPLHIITTTGVAGLGDVMMEEPVSRSSLPPRFSDEGTTPSTAMTAATAVAAMGFGGGDMEPPPGSAGDPAWTAGTAGYSPKTGTSQYRQEGGPESAVRRHSVGPGYDANRSSAQTVSGNTGRETGAKSGSARPPPSPATGAGGKGDPSAFGGLLNPPS